jgi:hypothetical protein
LRGKILLSKPVGLELAGLISSPNFAFIFYFFLSVRESRSNFFYRFFLNLEINSWEMNCLESEERCYCRSDELEFKSIY